MQKRNSRRKRIALAASLACVLILSGCSDTLLRVQVPIPNESPMPFDQYSKIILGGFGEKVEPDSFVPEKRVRAFFLKDVSTLIRKPVLDFPELSSDSPRLRTLGPALLITGNLNTTFKKRNIIDETHSKYGDLIRKFKDVQSWNMEMSVEFIDAESGKVISRFNTKRELKEAKHTDMAFNYIKLFNQVTDRFVGRLTVRESMQDRFLLTE